MGSTEFRGRERRALSRRDWAANTDVGAPPRILTGISMEALMEGEEMMRGDRGLGGRATGVFMSVR